jgi:uncharacterized cupin superfamily protein
VWHCTAGTFQWPFEGDEIIYVLDCAVQVEHERAAATLRARWPRVLSARRAHWHVARHVRKPFVHRHPIPLARKLVGIV